MSLLEKASLVVTPNAYKESKLYSVIPNTTLGDMDVVRATTATRINEQGLIEVVPRNLQKYSEQFENAYYDKSNCSITANSIAAPNGTMTADKLIMSNAQSGSSADGTGIRVLEDIASNAYIYSIYAKAGEFSTLRFRENQVTGAFLTINLTNGLITNGDANQYINPIAELITNGWYRISFKAPVATALYKYSVRVSETGNGTSGIYIWGYQVENSASLTTYFPTTTRLNIPRIDYTNGSCPSLLVEPQRSNLALYSEQFDNASWGKYNATITANNAISPNGTLNADKLVEDSANASHFIYSNDISVTAGSYYSFSFFAKKIDIDYISVTAGNYGQLQINSTFNINNGTVIASSGTAKITQIGDYYLCQVSGLSNTTRLQGMAIYLNRNNVAPPFSYTGNGTSGVYLWGAQFEEGNYSTSYIPTVASSVTRNADVISKTGISSLIGQTEGVIFADFVCNGFENYGTPFCINDGSTANSIWITTFGDGTIRGEVFGGSNVQASFSMSGGVVGQRYKLALAYKLNDFAMYINGNLIGTDFVGTVPINLSRADFDYANASSFVKSLLRINSAQLYKTRLTNTELAQLTTL